ncbi:uncharacterized protein LOC124110349 [Haliotis rufescens]|uniref:uncharacterized protein LOC124110349 n=1 Tax=Haliotis rufescens TaxID=6454 RepID=UPI00201F453F|nr:uncharacterized protein LOC124110349 [Haliotis rufescens]
MASPLAAYVLLLVSLGNLVQGIVVSTNGEEFAFAFFANFYNTPEPDPLNDIYISSTSESKCTIDYNYDDMRRRRIEVTIPAYSVTKETLPGSTQLNAQSGIENKGIHINCTNPVAVYGYNKNTNDYAHTSDSFTALPVAALTTEYIIPGVNNNPFFGVVSTRDNTSVTIHLISSCSVKFNNTLYKTGGILEVSLKRNDVLQIIHDSAMHSIYDCDFGGTYIKTSFPVSVFSGSVYYSPYGMVGSHLVLQVPPLSAFSTTAIVPRVPAPTSQTVVRLLASQNDTSVTITSIRQSIVSVYNASLTRREFKDFNITLMDTDLFIKSNKPVMVVQNSYFQLKGGMTLFSPGPDLYLTEYTFQTMDISGQHSLYSFCNLVCETRFIGSIYVNGNTSSDITWNNITSLQYSVGILALKSSTPYHIKSKHPFYLRVHGNPGYAAYGFTGGYKLLSHESKVLHLQCLTEGWFASVDLNELSATPSDISHIYMATDRCTGTLRGNILVFNVSYDSCHTERKVKNDSISFRNYIVYAAPSNDNITKAIKWRGDLECSKADHATDSVHIYPEHNATSHTGVSGEIQGPGVHISLFKDPAYQVPFVETQQKAQVGQPIFVQVSDPLSEDTIMILKHCYAHLTTDFQNSVSHLLLDKGCPVDSSTQVLMSRDHVTRFRFDMFDLPTEDDGLYVTCDVTFCDQMDFSPHCQQGCHTDPQVGIIG